MQRPDNWPFATWLDLDEVALDPTGALIAPLQRDYLSFIHSFLFETKLFSRPEYFRRVLYGVTADLYLGAASCEAYNPPGYAIAIYGGSWLQLLLSFQRLLAPPSVLAEYSTIAREDNKHHERSAGHGLPLLTPRGIETLFHENVASTAIDPGKAGVIRELIALGCRFLFLHEFIHIHRFHVDWLLLRESDGKLDEKERHGLEHLADLGAAVWAAHFAVLTGTIKARERTLSERKAILAQLKLQGFAAGVISLLLETLNPLVQSNYPAASWRSMFLQIGPSGSPSEFVGSLTRREVLDGIAAGFDHALEAWDLVGWARVDSRNLHDESVDAVAKKMESKEVDEYVESVMKTEAWSNGAGPRGLAAQAGRRALADAI